MTIVYGFDINMADGSVEFKVLKSDLQRMGTGVRKPVNDIDVLIKQRSGFEGAKWTYTVGKETDVKTVSAGEDLAQSPCVKATVKRREASMT
jgi:hypothetical protein